MNEMRLRCLIPKFFLIEGQCFFIRKEIIKSIKISIFDAHLLATFIPIEKSLEENNLEHFIFQSAKNKLNNILDKFKKRNRIFLLRKNKNLS